MPLGSGARRLGGPAFASLAAAAAPHPFSSPTPSRRYMLANKEECGLDVVQRTQGRLFRAVALSGQGSEIRTAALHNISGGTRIHSGTGLLRRLPVSAACGCLLPAADARLPAFAPQ